MLLVVWIVSWWVIGCCCCCCRCRHRRHCRRRRRCCRLHWSPDWKRKLFHISLSHGKRNPDTHTMRFQTIYFSFLELEEILLPVFRREGICAKPTPNLRRKNLFCFETKLLFRNKIAPYAPYAPNAPNDANAPNARYSPKSLYPNVGTFRLFFNSSQLWNTYGKYLECLFDLKPMDDNFQNSTSI